MDADSRHNSSSDESMEAAERSGEAMQIDEDGVKATDNHAYLNPFDDALSAYLYSDEVQESAESRERRHAAVSVLGDSELLMFHAVANNESIPQTRQRFLHHLVGIPPPITRRERCRDIANMFQPRLSPQPSTPIRYMSPSNKSVHGSAPLAASGSQKRGRHDDDARQRQPASHAFSARGKSVLPVVDVMEVNGRWAEPEPKQAGPSGGGGRTGRQN